MKRHASYLFPLFLIFLYSCTSNTPKSSANNAATVVDTSQCYTAIAGADSAHLTLHYSYSKIEGSLNMYFATKDNMIGKITGSFKGDTLYLDYTYQKSSELAYSRNPLAFLRKGGKLYQGYGEVALMYGRTYLKPGTITFDKGFVFSKIDCALMP